jgi:hypothetical protein
MTQVEKAPEKNITSSVAFRSIVTTILAAAATGVISFFNCDETIKEKIMLFIPAVSVLVSEGFLWIFTAYSPERSEKIKARRHSQQRVDKIDSLLKIEKDPVAIEDFMETRRAHLKVITE